MRGIGNNEEIKVTTLSNVITVTDVTEKQSTLVYTINSIPADRIISITPIIKTTTGGYAECLNIGISVNNNRYNVRGFSLTTIPSSVTLTIDLLIVYK